MSKMKMTYGRIAHVFFILLLAVSYYITIFVTAPGVPFNVYGYVKDDLGNVITGASVTVRSPIDQASATTNSEGKYAVTISVNGPGDQIQVTATYGSGSGSASGTVPSGSSSMQIDVTVSRVPTSISCSVSPSTLNMGGSVRSIFCFNSTSQKWFSYDLDLQEFGIKQEDFPIKPGMGTFIFTREETIVIYEEDED